MCESPELARLRAAIGRAAKRYRHAPGDTAAAATLAATREAYQVAKIQDLVSIRITAAALTARSRRQVAETIMAGGPESL